MLKLIHPPRNSELRQLWYQLENAATRGHQLLPLVDDVDIPRLQKALNKIAEAIVALEDE